MDLGATSATMGAILSTIIIETGATVVDVVVAVAVAGKMVVVHDVKYVVFQVIPCWFAEIDSVMPIRQKSIMEGIVLPHKTTTMTPTGISIPELQTI